MELVEYKMNLTCSLEFVVRARSAKEAIRYHSEVDNFVFYNIIKGKPGSDPRTMDKVEIIFNTEIDQDSVKAERIWKP